MVSGIAERFCFGPAEIEIMRRAMQMAEQALRHAGTNDLNTSLRQIAHSILRLTACGESDPLVLSALALREYVAPNISVIHPYERRPLTRRGSARRNDLSLRRCKIA